MAGTEGVVVPLCIYPLEKLSEADLSPLKKAFESLHLPMRVRPSAALPASPGTILAVGETPNFLCRYIYVASVDSPGLADAIKTVLLNLDDPWIVDELDMLNMISGGGYKEIDETIEEEV
jgi:hypothetical protein